MDYEPGLGLGNRENLLSGKQRKMITYRLVHTIGPFPAVDDMVNLGGKAVSVGNVAEDTGNGYVRIHCKLGLEMGGQPCE